MTTWWLASYLALWAVVAAMTLLLLGLLRQYGLIQMRLGMDPGALITAEGLERGTVVADFEATDVIGRGDVRLADLRGEKVMIVFLTSTCEACQEVASHLGQFSKKHSKEVKVLAVCSSGTASCGEFARHTRLGVPLLADTEGTIASAFKVRATPFAYLLDQNGVVLIRGIVNSWPHLEALLLEEGTLHGETPWEPGVLGPAIPETTVLTLRDEVTFPSREAEEAQV